MRDDFTQEVKRALSQRVAGRCSNPDCQAQTSGPQIDSGKALNLGVAAHITGASEGGPRYDPTLSSDQRRDAKNGIWLCQNCAKLVDNDPVAYPAYKLREWKRSTEMQAFLSIGKAIEQTRANEITAQELDILSAAAERGQIWRMGPYNDGSTWVRTNRTDFFDPSDRAYSAEYMDALDRLVARDLVRRERGIYHQLTGLGFRIAREVRSRLDEFGV